MKVICIRQDNYTYDNGQPIDFHLTTGKVYDVIKYDVFGCIKFALIDNDAGYSSYHSIDKFITLEDYREQQLNKIL